jgi:thiamine biosynthesis lipoprotein
METFREQRLLIDAIPIRSARTREEGQGAVLAAPSHPRSLAGGDRGNRGDCRGGGPRAPRLGRARVLGHGLQHVEWGNIRVGGNHVDDEPFVDEVVRRRDLGHHHHNRSAILDFVHSDGDVRRNLTMTVTVASETGLTARSFRAIGTRATVVVQEPDQARLAECVLNRALEEIDLACSRFRGDSELAMLHAEAGRAVRVSGLLFEALEVACAVATRTGGAVDPTVGNAICALGYDADLAEVQTRRAPLPPKALGVVPGYQHVQLNPRTRAVRIPRGVRLDLGSSAKALAADRAAVRIAHAVNGGVLVSLGGDVAVAGPSPRDGWAVGIAHESSAPADEVDQVVAIRHGGLASSAVGARTWRSGHREVHHIVDPRTGDCAEPHWSLVSATGASCVDANLVTTASLVWGADALDQLRRYDQSVRLVRFDRSVFRVNGWPDGGTP